MTSRKLNYAALSQAESEDIKYMMNDAIDHAKEVPQRMLCHLAMLASGVGGFPVDRLTHSLQMAHRVERAGKSDEYVLAALIHDAGEILGPFNHGDISAAYLKNFIDTALHWVVQNHNAFQCYNYAHHLGMDRNVRDQFRDNPCFDLGVEFAEFDQLSFDPSYDTPPLERYSDLVISLMSRSKAEREGTVSPITRFELAAGPVV
jgi:predicted HD phosphohydrolase